MSLNHVAAILRSFINRIRVMFVDVWHYGLFSFISLVFTLSSFVGCQPLQKRMTQESAKCGALCAQARAAREKGNSDQADQYINEALRQKPGDIETRRQLAETMWNSGRRTEAVAMFTSLSAKNPKDAKLSGRLAVMQWENKQHTEAASTALATLKLDPESKEAWLIKARSEVAGNRLDDALASYIQLSQLEPGELTSTIELGELHLKRGHPERACPLFRDALQNSQATPDQRAQVEWMLGVTYVRCQRWSVAVTVLERAIIRRSSSADDWCMLSLARFQNGDFAGAQADLQRAFEQDPHSLEARKLAEKMEISANSQSFVTPASHHNRP